LEAHLCMRVRKYTSKADLRERAHKVVGAFLEKKGRIFQGFNQLRERAQVSDLVGKGVIPHFRDN
jgi:hypothetical protein